MTRANSRALRVGLFKREHRDFGPAEGSIGRLGTGLRKGGGESRRLPVRR
jgi:hypothetical protein